MVKLIVKIKKPSNYCSRIKGRLPFPIECDWVGEMHECCRNCDKKIDYISWKNGDYADMAEEIAAGDFDPKDYGIE